MRERVSQQYRVVPQTVCQRLCGVSRAMADITASVGRGAATRARVVTLYQETGGPRGAIGRGGGRGPRYFHPRVLHDL
eukprot:8833301-Lingulodinium_polyedra.AAC.1